MAPGVRGVMAEKNTIAELLSRGWTRRFTASGDRLREAVENYRSLGFEVRTIPVREAAGDDCTVCFTDEPDPTMLIFTRPVSSSENNKLSEENNGPPDASGRAG